MSTFGKKALVWWDYESEEYIRFRHTPEEVQLKILEKWYPIGSKCAENRKVYLNSVKLDLSYNFKIVGYTKYKGQGYLVRYEFIEPDDVLTGRTFDRNPLSLRLYPNDLKTIKRETKLERLGF